MENLNTKNLQALIKGHKLNAYQRAEAIKEYTELVKFAYEADKKVKTLNIVDVSNSFVFIVQDAKTHNAISYVSSYEKAQEEIVRLKAYYKTLEVNTQKIY